MAESLGTIYYDVDANLEPLLGKMRQAEAALGGMGKEMKGTDRTSRQLGGGMNRLAEDVRRANQQGSRASSIFGDLRGIMAGVVAALGIRQLVQYTETWSDLNSRIRNVVKDGELAEETLRRISETARRTYSSLEDTAEAFLANAQVLTELGYSTDRQLDLSDALNNALVVSGTRGQHAASVMDALSKAMAEGTLRGQNFNTVIGRGGRVVEALADGLGVTTLELRRLSQDGALTTEVVFEALTSQMEKLRAEADAMPATIGDGFTLLNNALLELVGRMDEASGTSGGFASVLIDLADLLQDPATVEGLQNLAVQLGTLVGWLVQAAAATATFFDELITGLANFATGRGGIESDSALMEEAIHRVTLELNELTAALSSPDWLLRIRGLDRGELEARARSLRLEIQGLRGTLQQIEAEEAAAALDAALGGVLDKLGGFDTPAKNAANGIRLVREEKKKAKTDADRAAEAIARTIAALELEADTLGMTRSEVELYKLSLAGASDEQIRAAASALAAVDNYNALEQAAKDLAAAEEEKARQQERAAEANLRNLGVLDPVAGETMRFEEQLSQLRALNEAKLIEDQRYLELRQQAEAEHQQNLRDLQEETFKQQSMANAILMDSMDRFAASAANAFTGIISGATTSREAIQQLAQGILSQAVSALAQMGMQQVKNMILGQAAATTAAATGTAAATTLAAAYAAPAALASLASFGANAPPAQAGIASTMALTKGLSVAGGRLAGGPVSAGSMYRVNENGAPEVFSAANGQQFMIPNQRGEVISNRNATAGGGGVVINIHNAPQGTVAESSQDQDGQQMIDIWVADFMSDGRTASAVQGKFGLSPQGR